MAAAPPTAAAAAESATPATRAARGAAARTRGGSPTDVALRPTDAVHPVFGALDTLPDHDKVYQHIQALRTSQSELRAQRKLVAKELKNAQKRRRRLKARARQLSNDDLLAVLLMRKDDMATAVPEDDNPSGPVGEPVAPAAANGAVAALPGATSNPVLDDTAAHTGDSD